MILIVEDDLSQSHLLRVVLEGEGLSVRIVDHDFKRLLDPNSPLYEDVTVICTDLDLGPVHVDGKDILKFVKEHFPAMKRVVMTGWEEPLDEYADVVLYKVVAIDDIIEALT